MFSQLIDVINSNSFNGINIELNDYITSSLSEEGNQTDFVTFSAKVESETGLISFSKKYAKLDSNEDFVSFHTITKDKFIKDFIEFYFLKGINCGD